MSNFVVHLRRNTSSELWGFRLRGGADQGIPLHIDQVKPKGLAGNSGLLVGDYIVALCGKQTNNMSHEQVKSEMLRAGNELDLTVLREGAAGPAVVTSAVCQSEEKRVEIDEQPIQKFGGPTFKQVKPKTYQVLEQQLQTGDIAEQETATATATARPSSIFDRKKTDRSAYLKANSSTIQKAYGENS